MVSISIKERFVHPTRKKHAIGIIEIDKRTKISLKKQLYRFHIILDN